MPIRISKSLFLLLLLCSALFATGKRAYAADNTITLAYPVCNGSTVLCDDLADGVWRFKVNYTLANVTDFATAIVSLGSNCDTYYENCSNWPADLKDLDPYQLGYFWTPSDTPNPITVDGTVRVYRVDVITDHGNGSYLFNVTHSTNENPQVYMPPESPPTYNCGELGQWLCDLFIPDEAHLHLFTNSLPDDMGARAPFAYMTDISDIITSMQEALAGKKNKNGTNDFKSIFEAKQNDRMPLTEKAKIKYEANKKQNDVEIEQQNTETQTVLFTQPTSSYSIVGNSGNNYAYQNLDCDDLGSCHDNLHQKVVDKIKVKIKSTVANNGKFLSVCTDVGGSFVCHSACQTLIGDDTFYDYTFTLNSPVTFGVMSQNNAFEIDLNNSCGSSVRNFNGITFAGSHTNPLAGLLQGVGSSSYDDLFVELLHTETVPETPLLLTIPIDVDGTVKNIPIFDPYTNNFSDLKDIITPYVTMVAWFYVLAHIGGRVMDMVL